MKSWTLSLQRFLYGVAKVESNSAREPRSRTSGDRQCIELHSLPVVAAPFPVTGYVPRNPLLTSCIPSTPIRTRAHGPLVGSVGHIGGADSKCFAEHPRTECAGIIAGSWSPLLPAEVRTRLQLVSQPGSNKERGMIKNIGLRERARS
jgi:hypothetical protein